ncbi:hypothetical protein PR002_g30426 [Phytophthora rubi]|uniref:Uncharacterized protein n=1 Tax=Phytophthora rubi TaxID=129364 RepID=A0A6A3GQH9_9STRA|nr:hypothetical protein PR002_g30426 [Phytophthora rubi]
MSEWNSSKAGAQPSSKPKRARDVLFEDFEEGMVSQTEDQEGSPGAGPQSTIAFAFSFALTGEAAAAFSASPAQSSRQLEVRRETSRSNIAAALPLVMKSRKDYRFGGSKDPAKEATELAKGSLVEYVIGPATRSDAELAKRDTWRKRLLTPQTTSPAEYCARLDAQLVKCSVPQINRIPVVLLRGEDEVEDDVQFQNWAEKARKLSSLDALRASYRARDIYLERRLCFMFAKRKARQHHSSGQEPRPHGASTSTPAASASAPYSEALSDVSSPRSSAGKRGSTDTLAASSCRGNPELVIHVKK